MASKTIPKKKTEKKKISKKNKNSFLNLAEKLYVPSYATKKEQANNEKELTRNDFLEILGRVSRPVKPQSNEKD